MVWKRWSLAAWLLTGALFAGSTLAQDDTALDLGDDDPEGVEVLTRGPVHEAFATPVTGEVKGYEVISKEPPENVDEVPPDLKPEGENVAWIPGYWQWDEERDDFLWVSGVWRKSPPQQRWVPGYWNKVDNGWQWVSGFWASDAEAEVTYYDPPPATLEEGPTSDAPGDDYFWTPGVWMYTDSDYRWRPGFWARSQANWMWMPDRWVWTPSGAVYTAGYWDYDLAYRGSAFMPVYFQRSVYTRPGFVWRPRIALNAAGLLANFWIRPNYGHYYFGNYYGGNYGRWGYTPMNQFWGRRGGWGWDPIVAYNQAYYRPRGINYANRMNQWHNFYVNNPNRRPPNTWREQRTIIRDQNVNINNINNVVNADQFLKGDISAKPANVPNVMGLPINTLARASERKGDDDQDRLRYAKVDKREQELVAARSKQVRQNNVQRAKAEARANVAVNDGPDRKNAKVRTTFKLPVEEGPGSINPRTRDDQLGTKRPDGDDRPDVRRPDRDDRPDVKRPMPGDKPDVKRPDPDDKPRVVSPNALDEDRPGKGKPDGEDRPDPKPGTRPRGDRPPPRPDFKPNEDRPDPKPKVDRPDPKPDRPDPKPKVDRPDPKPDRPDPKPKVDRPDPKPDRPKPPPKVNRPDPKPGPQPRPNPPGGGGGKPGGGNPGKGKDK